MADRRFDSSADVPDADRIEQQTDANGDDETPRPEVDHLREADIADQLEGAATLPEPDDDYPHQ